MAVNLIKSGVASEIHNGRRIGPFVDTNNNVYCFTEDLRQLEAWKASDPTGGSWTEQDSTNNPNSATDNIQSYSCHQSGDTIHITVTWGSDPKEVRYYTFLTSDHSTNPDEWSVDEQVDATPDQTGITRVNSDITVRSNGDVIILYTGETDKVMGVDRDRVDYAKRTGVATWSSANAVDAGGEIDYWPVSAILAESDRVWFDYVDDANVDFLQESINSSDTQQNLATIEGSAQSFSTAGAEQWQHDYSQSVYYDDDGTPVICRAFMDSSGNFRARYTRSGTLQTVTTIATDESTTSSPSLCVNGKKVYCIYIDTGNDLVYRANDDEGGWDGSSTEIHNATNAGQMCSANVINRGGDDLVAVVWFDNDATSGIKYSEISIGAPPAPTGHSGKMTLLGVQ